MSSTIVYLDICALKRPFDDARSERIRREADIDQRSRLLTGLGFGPLDALHLALEAGPAHAR